MKKTLSILALAVLFFVNTSYAQKKVAVVSFFINKQIDVTEFGPAAQAAVIKLGDDPNFNVAPLLKRFHSEFFDNYSKDFPFQLLPEDQVTGNAQYKTFTPIGIAQNGVLKASNWIIPVDGYKVILSNLAGHENEKNLVKIFTDADGVMDVSIDFKLIKVGFGGMGVTKMVAIATVALFNKDGNKVFIVRQESKSKKVSPLVAGIPVMTAEKIMPMCEGALDELMADLQKDLPKMIRKTDAKL